MATPIRELFFFFIYDTVRKKEGKLFVYQVQIT